MHRLTWPRGLAVGSLLLPYFASPVIAQVTSPPSPPPLRSLAIKQIWMDRSAVWGGQPAPTLCVAIDANGLSGQMLELDIRFLDTAREPVRVSANSPESLRGDAGELRTRPHDVVRFDAASWDPARFVIPESALDPPIRNATLRAVVRAKCGEFAVEGEQPIRYPPSESPIVSTLRLVDLAIESDGDAGRETNVAGMGDDPRIPHEPTRARVRVSATIEPPADARAGLLAELSLLHSDGEPVGARRGGSWVSKENTPPADSQASQSVRFEVDLDEVQLRAGLDHALIAQLRIECSDSELTTQRAFRLLHFSSGPPTESTDSSAVSLLGEAQKSDESTGVSQTHAAGYSELLVAAASGAADRIRELLADGSDPAVCDDAGRTPQHLAASAGHVDAVRALLAGAPPKSAPAGPALIDGRPANLFASDARDAAAKSGGEQEGQSMAEHIESLSFDRYLEKRDALEVRDKRGRTPLHLAAANGYAEVIAALCENGADLSAEDDRGATPLHLAAACGRADAIAALLHSGAYPLARTRSGCLAAELATDEKCAALLREARTRTREGPEADAVRAAAEALFGALRRGDSEAIRKVVTLELAASLPANLEMAAFEFRVSASEAHGGVGRARVWLKVPDIEAVSNEFVADLTFQQTQAGWRVSKIFADPFIPALEKLEDRP